MKIGITGPISTESVAHLIGPQAGRLPKGMLGAPFMGALITSLLERGHEVSAYTLDWKLPGDLEQPIIAQSEGFSIYYGPYRNHAFRPCGRSLGRMADFFRLERRAIASAIAIDHPDVVHAHWVYEFALAALDTGLPTVITSHDSPLHVLRFMPNLYRFGRFLMALKVLRKSSHLTAVSGYLQKVLGPLATAKIQVIANPIPIRRFIDSIKLRSKARIEPRIAMINNGWMRLKNPARALHAFKLFRGSHPGATLHAYGIDFGPGEIADAWARDNGFADGVVFHGSIPHKLLMEELATMDILLHPSLLEACPMVLVEAMSLGVVVIGAQECGGVRWVLDNGNAGVLTNAQSTMALAQAMSSLINDETLRFAMAQKGIDRVREQFSSHKVANAYEMVYREAIAATGATAWTLLK